MHFKFYTSENIELIGGRFTIQFEIETMDVFSLTTHFAHVWVVFHQQRWPNQNTAERHLLYSQMLGCIYSHSDYITLQNAIDNDQAHVT